MSDLQKQAITKKIDLRFSCWFETVSEDEQSNLSVSKCCLKQNVLNCSQTISFKKTFFSWNLLYIVHKLIKYFLLENSITVGNLLFRSNSHFRVHSFQSSTKLYAKYMNVIFGDQFFR